MDGLVSDGFQRRIDAAKDKVTTGKWGVIVILIDKFNHHFWALSTRVNIIPIIYKNLIFQTKVINFGSIIYVRSCCWTCSWCWNRRSYVRKWCNMFLAVRVSYFRVPNRQEHHHISYMYDDLPIVTSIFFRQLVQLAIDRHPAVKVRLEQLLHTLNTHLAAIEKHEKQVFQLFKDLFDF